MSERSVKLMEQITTYKDLKRANFRLIEKELYHYKLRKKELLIMKADIIDGGGQPEVPVYSGPGDPTGRKAIKLSSGVIREIEKRLSAIEWALGVVERTQEPAKLKLIQLKYFERRLTDRGIQEKLGISKRTFYRWRKEFVLLIADRLGWEVE
jgi:RinA family phage transcriptional activator